MSNGKLSKDPRTAANYMRALDSGKLPCSGSGRQIEVTGYIRTFHTADCPTCGRPNLSVHLATGFVTDTEDEVVFRERATEVAVIPPHNRKRIMP